MSDTNYMNAFVNLTVETLHSYLNEILQLKTQAKLLNDLVLEKDQVISSLNGQLESLSNERADTQNLQAELQKVKDETSAEMQRLRDSADSWENQFNLIKDKASHLDTLANQHNDLQRQFNDKIVELTNVGNELTQTRKMAESKESEIVNLRQTHEAKIKEIQQKLESLNGELDAANKKIERLTKKEDKKIVVSTPVVPPKKDINKEGTKSASILQKPKETDDDF